ncbi:MAG: hypothetical protein IKF52_06240 [Clostridia bacterium]|nr:hypothetical protein [Clostridia bacterium]
MRNKIKLASNFVILGIIFIFGFLIYCFYAKYYFNDFIKAQVNPKGTSFYRDNKVKATRERSYCIENSDYNDAVFYKTVDVEPNTFYKVSCFVKTENVQGIDNKKSGACINILGTSEQSETISGSTDWQEISLKIDSKDKDSLDIGFRLGGIGGECIGKAWFSDMKIEKGEKDEEENDWDVVCFIIDNINATLNGKVYNISMTQEDKTLIKDNLDRFERTCESFSNDQMKINTHLFDLNQTITSLSYDETNGYYISPEDVRDIITPYLEQEEYDHIFIATRMGDKNQKVEIPINDWIGLRWNGF